MAKQSSSDATHKHPERSADDIQVTCTIEQRQTIPSFQGASGIESLNGKLYLVGDNVSYLLQTDPTLREHTAIPVIPAHQPALSAIKKPKKPDFEALTTVQHDGNTELLVMGSGSKDPRRWMVRVNPATQQVTPLYSGDDYNFLTHSADLTGNSGLNIEALTEVGDRLFVFQRGNLNGHHGVLIFDRDCVMQANPLERCYAGHLNVRVPLLDGEATGISGACWLTAPHLIACTASSERTQSTYSDGEIVGSLVGVVTPDGRQSGWTPLCDQQGQILPLKVEGIAQISSTLTDAQCWLVTDSDGGDSELLTVRLTWRFDAGKAP